MKIGKYIILLVSAYVLSWLIPSVIRYFDKGGEQLPFTIYSCLTKGFVYNDTEKDVLSYRSFNGDVYIQNQVDSILPTLFYRQLVADNSFPDTICGEKVTPKLMQHYSFFFKSSPRAWNSDNPKLYPLLESQSKRVDLVMPKDMFRFTQHEIEFINSETNSVDVSKSAMFQQIFEKKGVTFPIQRISGNPTARKEYDFGFLIVDGDGKLFHLKQVVGRPYLRLIPTPKPIEFVSLTEFRSRKFLGFVADIDKNLYVIEASDYSLHQLPIDSFDAGTEQLSIIGNYFDWSVEKDSDKMTNYYAINAKDYSLLLDHSIEIAPRTFNKILKWILPFELSFTSFKDTYVKPRYSSYSFIALPLSILLCLIYIFISKGNIFRDRREYFSILLILLGGVYGFIPILLLKTHN